MKKVFIGIDNGATGSIGIIESTGCDYFMQTPSKKEQSYTKKKQNISRVDFSELTKILKKYSGRSTWKAYAVIERPFTSSQFINTVKVASRAFEATLIALEQLKIGYEVVDSKGWQKEFLPKGIKGSANLKKASRELGIRQFPQHEETIKRQKDADGLFLAKYCQKTKEV